jgi:hypothetical protein
MLTDEDRKLIEKKTGVNVEDESHHNDNNDDHHNKEDVLFNILRKVLQLDQHSSRVKYYFQNFVMWNPFFTTNSLYEVFSHYYRFYFDHWFSRSEPYLYRI